MKISDKNLVTPVYLKTDSSFVWPEEEPVFHLLTGDGLFLCRNHPFFRSSTAVPTGPSELAAHQSFMELNYPKIPRLIFEQIIGFFDRIGMGRGAEAAVLLAWNRETKMVDVIVPPQKAMVGSDSRGKPFPINVWYEMPQIPDELIVFGDAHSHVEESATASKTDIDDDAERPGLHIIVGRLDQEPPEISVHVTVDGARFRLKNPLSILEGYHKRRTGSVPDDWVDQVKVTHWTAKKYD